MPDIMMCDDPICPLSKRCYRHSDSGTRADPYRQTYWLREDGSPRGDDCPNFWERTTLVAAAHDVSLP
jgi:hypothetical protein